MLFQRSPISMGILIVLLLTPGYPVHSGDPAPLAGTNSVSSVQINLVNGGVWRVDFDYYFAGAPTYAALIIVLIPKTGSMNAPGKHYRWETEMEPPKWGAHHASATLIYPGGEGTTESVDVQMLTQLAGGTVIANQKIDQLIHWPNYSTWIRDQEVAQNSPKENFNRAVSLIDSGSEAQLAKAKSLLEKLIANDTHFDAGYVELARIAIKSTGGVEGYHQAENLLSSALQIRPDSVNAKILLGYVYTHQSRYAKAEALFAEAAQSKTSNLWLWVNWGELLTMQGQVDQAIVKYREAIARPMTHDTYDHARSEAYRILLGLLKRKGDLDGMEVLFKQRLGEFGPGSCYSSEYALFLLQVRSDTQGAIDLAHGALNQDCEDSAARQVLGLSQYVKWASTTEPQRTEALNQARLFLPAGPMPLYLLATTDRTLPVAKQLIATGEPIDQKDNEKLTALAYALQKGDLSAARRLITLGALPETPVGYGDVPVALMPVMEGNIEAVRMFQDVGVDYSKVIYRGETAIDFAKQTGDNALLKVLTDKGATL